MKIISIDSGFALYKEKDEIGRCALTPTSKGGTFGAFCILPQWRRKGYGSYLLKEALRALGGYDREQATVFTAPLPTDPGEAAFWAKFDFQPEGIASTRAHLAQKGFTAELHCDSHANLLQYVTPGTADAVMFNFGWLPGADHAVFSTAGSSIPALEAALTALRPGGVLSAILYSGRVIGSDEKRHILQWARALPLTKCTVLVCDFANWADTAPLPCLILKK